jgi:ABC-type multidrug transport system fused ATPase/permease subunit
MGISSIIVSFVKGWKLAIVLNSYIPIIVVLNFVKSQIHLQSKVLTADMNAKMNGDVFEVFENIKTVKYLGGEDYELDRYSKDLE